MEGHTLAPPRLRQTRFDVSKTSAYFNYSSVTETGKFMDTVLPAGTYRVVVSHADYESFTSEPFTIKSNGITTVTIHLRICRTIQILF